MKCLFRLLNVLVLTLLAPGVAIAETSTTFDSQPVGVDEAIKVSKEFRWWQKREKRSDIYYPHNVHMEVMKKEGDPCMLCHPFTKNRVTDIKQVKSLSVIANEPLEAICHDCHVDKLTATSRCDICHSDPTAIWPDDHNFAYLYHHAEDARLDEGQCRSCHIDLSFCTDCHFRRDSTQRRVHTLGYRTVHGIEARMNAAQCSRCHESRYCTDCHREIP